MIKCENFKTIVIKTFKVEQPKGIHFYAARYYVTLTSMFLFLLIIMSLAICYMKRTSLKKLHRQNIYTLKSTLFWGFLHFGILILYHIAQIQKDFFFCSVLRFVLIFFTQFIKYVILIIDLRKNLPELFSDSNIHYGCNCIVLPVSCPRSEPLMPFIPFKQNAR